MKTTIIAMLCAVLLFSSVFAQDTVDASDVEITLDESGSALVQTSLILDSTDMEKINVPQNGAQSIRAYDVSGELQYAKEGDYIVVTPSEKTKAYSFTVEYITQALTSKDTETWSVDFPISFGYSVSNLIIASVLPEGCSVKSLSEGAMVSTENNRVLMEWYFDRVSEERISFSYMKKAQTYTSTAKASDKSTEEPQGLDGVLIIVSLLIAVAVIILLIRHSNSEKANKSQEVINALPYAERQIISALLEKGGKTTQAEIMNQTGMPKATMSRNIRSLEGKGLLKISDNGNTNLVEVGDWINN